MKKAKREAAVMTLLTLATQAYSMQVQVVPLQEWQRRQASEASRAQVAGQLAQALKTAQYVPIEPACAPSDSSHSAHSAQLDGESDTASVMSFDSDDQDTLKWTRGMVEELIQEQADKIEEREKPTIDQLQSQIRKLQQEQAACMQAKADEIQKMNDEERAKLFKDLQDQGRLYFADNVDPGRVKSILCNKQDRNYHCCPTFCVSASATLAAVAGAFAGPLAYGLLIPGPHQPFCFVLFLGSMGVGSAGCGVTVWQCGRLGHALETDFKQNRKSKNMIKKWEAYETETEVVVAPDEDRKVFFDGGIRSSFTSPDSSPANRRPRPVGGERTWCDFYCA